MKKKTERERNSLRQGNGCRVSSSCYQNLSLSLEDKWGTDNVDKEKRLLLEKQKQRETMDRNGDGDGQSLAGNKEVKFRGIYLYFLKV
jgi:hypothetical protein